MRYTFYSRQTRVPSFHEENPLISSHPVLYRLVRGTRTVHGASSFVPAKFSEADLKSDDLRAALLKVIAETSPGSSLQSSSVLQTTANQLGIRGDATEQALLTQFQEFFRTGYLAWGLNLSNPNPPFFHLTEQGRKTLAQLSGDPGNPAGYMKRIDALAPINPIAKSYLVEALRCYVADLNKAAAVMVGGSAESLIIELRDEVSAKLATNGQSISTDLNDWRTAKILKGLKTIFDQQKFPTDLTPRYASFWPAFTQQIRAARNEAGHPSAIEPVTSDTVHASLLIFPELLKLANELRQWVSANL
jgi:hypothetical protein